MLAGMTIAPLACRSPWLVVPDTARGPWWRSELSPPPGPTPSDRSRPSWSAAAHRQGRPTAARMRRRRRAFGGRSIWRSPRIGWTCEAGRGRLGRSRIRPTPSGPTSFRRPPRRAFVPWLFAPPSTVSPHDFTLDSPPVHRALRPQVLTWDGSHTTAPVVVAGDRVSAGAAEAPLLLLSPGSWEGGALLHIQPGYAVPGEFSLARPGAGSGTWRGTRGEGGRCHPIVPATARSVQGHSD